MSDKHAVIRVSSIPLKTTVAALHSALPFPVPSQSHTTLCTFPYSSSLTAVVHLPGPVPKPLESLGHGEAYKAKIGPTGHPITIDRDFYGLTQLYETRGTIHADIVAVCDLDSHAYNSWTTDQQGQRRIWLRNFLGEDLPGCRTMIYGYNSSLSADSCGSERISDYVDGFLGELNNVRKSNEEKKRKLTFIGHGLGGIIITQALVKAKENPKNYGPLFSSTRAIIFLGTPHRGFPVDDILAMIGEESSRNALVKSLKSGSPELAAGLARFINYSAGANMKIVSFKEGAQSLKLKKGGDGKWTRSGDPYVAVDAASAVLRLPEGREVSFMAEGDHSTMVKFQQRDNFTYKTVVSTLKSAMSSGP